MTLKLPYKIDNNMIPLDLRSDDCTATLFLGSIKTADPLYEVCLQ